jgi:putative transposase
MPYRKEEFTNGEVYHIIIRAIDDNLIFKDTSDYFRGIFSIYEFNNSKRVTIQAKRRLRIAFKKLLEKADRHRVSIKTPEFVDERDKMVEVLAFCFMPNHIHLLLKQIKDGGISKFMQKNGIGLGKYFNTKYQRKGHVFQDTFKAVHIEGENQFMIVVSYIFTNPVALVEPGWKENGIRNHSVKEVLKFLENYKWSSYQDCIGIQNFKYVTQRDFLMQVVGGEQGCKNVIKNWVESKIR